MIYKCEQCGERIIKGKLKHIIVCLNCGKVNDVHVHRARAKAEGDGNSVNARVKSFLASLEAEPEQEHGVLPVKRGSSRCVVCHGDKEVNGELCRGCDGQGFRHSVDKHRDGLD